MKKLTLIFVFLFLTLFVNAQFTKPAGAVALPTYSFFWNPADSAVTVYQGTARQYNTFVQHFDTTKLSGWVNNRKLLSYRQIRDTLLKNGTVSNYRLLHKIDSVMNLVYTKHVADSMLLLKVDKITDHSLVRNSLRDSIPTALFKKDSILFITPYRLLRSLPVGYELEITTAGVTVLSLPFTLSDRTLVFYNGSVLSKNLWSGVGISTLTLMVDTKLKDLLKIQNQ